MSSVAVEIVAPAEAPTMTRALLDACSSSVRVGSCELATRTTSEPRLASATVRWSDASERSVRIDVTAGARDASAVRLRVLAFKDTDAIVERWRAVGLTIATLVGDALANAPSGPAPVDASTGTENANAVAAPQNPGAVQATEAKPSPKAAAAPEQQQKEAVSRTPVDRSRTLEPSTARHEATPSGATPLPRMLWATVAGQTGPGLESDSFRFGASVDAAFRPAAFPVFGRVAFGYSSRGTDSRGLSVQWENAVAGAGVVVGSGALRLEPRAGIGLENVHAHETDPATKHSASGNSLGPSFQLGLDGVFQLGHFGFVLTLEGTQKHAPTQILVEGRDFGTSAATTWGVGAGVRYYVK
ncbi:MAG TPA: hypothetical protein VHC69_16710 [Polyangiaceae bacterium]|nr:hypothetical protein [Polyangiaceae bacterium]